MLRPEFTYDQRVEVDDGCDAKLHDGIRNRHPHEPDEVHSPERRCSSTPTPQSQYLCETWRLMHDQSLSLPEGPTWIVLCRWLMVCSLEGRTPPCHVLHDGLRHYIQENA